MATPQGPSLPPSVEGRVRAGIRLSVRGLAWAKQYPGRGRDGFVRAKWWGQTDGGTLVKPPVSGVPFSPDIGRAGDVSFPVRCPLTKLIHYLSDAHHLVLDVVDTKKQRAVGRAKVPFKVATARLGTVIAEGDVEVKDASLRTIGTLQVVLTLEPPPPTRQTAADLIGPDATPPQRPPASGGDAQVLLDAGLESTAAFVQNELLAQAGLGGGSLDPSGILDGMPPQPMAAPRSAAELFAPMPAASAAGGARPGSAPVGAHGRRKGGRRSARPAPAPAPAPPGSVAAVRNHAEQLRDRIARASEEPALPPARWDTGPSVPPASSSLATWQPTPSAADPGPLAGLGLGAPGPESAAAIPEAMQATITSLRSMRLYIGRLEFSDRYRYRALERAPSARLPCSDPSSPFSVADAPFFYLSCQFPAWFAPAESCVAGSLQPGGGAIDFSYSAIADVGGRSTSAAFWALGKVVLVLRGVRPVESFSGGGPADEVLGVGWVALRQLLEAPRCKLELELEMRGRGTGVSGLPTAAGGLDGAIVGRLSLSAELREEPAQSGARR